MTSNLLIHCVYVTIRAHPMSPIGRKRAPYFQRKK